MVQIIDWLIECEIITASFSVVDFFGCIAFFGREMVLHRAQSAFHPRNMGLSSCELTSGAHKQAQRRKKRIEAVRITYIRCICIIINGISC